jgi:hypothetical protein
VYLDGRKVAVILAHATAGWVLCFATIGIGLAVTTVTPALIVHAIGAPVYFGAVSLVYFTRFGYTTPVRTALVFTGFVMVVDFLVVALVILGSLDMFANPLGTWLPFGLIFLSTWLTGTAVDRRRSRRTEHADSGRREPVDHAA